MEIEALSSNRIRLRVNHAASLTGHTMAALDKNGVRGLRGCLASAGPTPSQIEAREK